MLYISSLVNRIRRHPLALSLVVPTLLLPHLSPPAPPLRARMQLFPTDDTGSVSVKITDSKGVTIRKPAPPTRGERLARLLSDMAEQPLEAEALLDGLQAAMTADGDLLSADETAALQSDMKDLEILMAANQPDDIREATEILGKASEVFAARRMDRSIQKALQGVSLSELDSDVAEESTP